jgi:hypothetical protein
MTAPKAPIPGTAAVTTALMVSGAALSVAHVTSCVGLRNECIAGEFRSVSIGSQIEENPMLLEGLTIGPPTEPPIIIKKHAAYRAWELCEVTEMV